MSKCIKRYRYLAIIILLIFFILTIFTSCSEKEPEPLRICIDIEYSVGCDTSTLEADVDHLLITRLREACSLKGISAPRDLIVEYLPAKGEERNIALQKIRTEIMAGGGPDLFIVACNEKNSELAEDALFTIPEKAMELNLFLTLDKYMDNETHFAEWNKMNSIVLSAGRNNDGQQIIPMCYRIPVSVYEKTSVDCASSIETTWMDMLSSDNIALAAAAIWTDNTAEYREGMPFIKNRAPMTEFILGKIADFNEETLLFTEDELQQRLDEIIKLADRYSKGEFDTAPNHYVEYLGQSFDTPMQSTDIEGNKFDARNGITREDDYAFIPLYSDDGGVTAEITMYTAINRNTERPEDAFLILDYLMSYSAQRSDRIYTSAVYTSYGIGSGIDSFSTGNLPMYDALMSSSQRIYWVNPVVDNSANGWYLSDHNFAELNKVRQQITHARFRSALDMELSKLYWDYLQAKQTKGDLEAIVSEGYNRMQRLLME